MSLALVVLAGCAPGPSNASQGASPGDSQPATRKRITAAINSNPATLSSNLTLTLAGTTEIDALTHGALSTRDRQQVLQPMLGEAVPSIENGLWKLFPDGRMETTWRIKPTVFWHDGVPLASDDLVFTLVVVRDKEVPFLGNNAFSLIESVEATDRRTMTVRWRQPFIGADTLYALSGSAPLALPLPKHKLEQPYLTDKANFIQHPYWSDEFVGAGPYRVREFARGSYLTLEAFEQYVLGRPKIDEIEIQFIPDGTTLIANVLAGTVDVVLGRGISLDQGQTIREQWHEGQVDFNLNSVITVYPQFTNPSPAVIGNAQFRRALLQALNREEMASTLMGGLSPVADSPVKPQDPDYPSLAPGIVKYAYDPRQATELIQGLGYTKAPGGQFQDSSNQPLSFEIRSAGSTDTQTKPLFAAVGYWQQVGLSVEPVVIPEQRLRELEYVATYPGFDLEQRTANFANLTSLKSDARALPENNFQTASSKNVARYANPEMDALIDRYFVTIPRTERLAIEQQVVHRVTDEVIWLTFYYTTVAAAISNRLQNVAGAIGDKLASWNAQEWDLR